MWPPSYFDFIRLLQDTPFLLDLARRAADITIHQSFSTSFTSILWNVAIFVWVLKRIYSREGGLAAVMKHWGNARDAIFAIVVAYLITFIVHAFITVPHEIRLEAKQKPTLPAIPHLYPPFSAYVKHIAAASHDRGDEPMDRGYPHVIDINIHTEMAGSYATVLLRNIGRYRIIPPVMIRGAVIASRFLFGPDEEKKYLFSGQENSQKGGLLIFPGNYWDPGDTQQVTIRAGWPFDPEEWQEIVTCTKEDCKKAVYVVTKTYAQGSCWYVSAIDWGHIKKCFGHND